jgi:hypothetical protein
MKLNFIAKPIFEGFLLDKVFDAFYVRQLQEEVVKQKQFEMVTFLCL